MKRFPAWLIYTVLRLLFFFVPLGVLIAVGLDWLWALLISTVLAFVLSMFLLRRPREATSIALHEAQERRKTPKPTEEELTEDAHADEVREAAEQQQRNRQAALDAEAGSAESNALGNIEGA